MTRKQTLGQRLALVFIAGLAVCTIAAAPAGKKDLVVLQAAEVQKFDPHMSTSEPDTKVTFNIFDNLVMRDDDLTLKPALATEWKRISNTVWEFKLRPGIKFHNGEPLTAETVRFSLARTSPSGDPNVITRTTFTTFDKVEAVDASTIRIITKVPDPFVPDRLAMYGGQIIPKQYFEKVGAVEFNAKPVGTGPLKFVEWVKDDHASFEAVKDWWGGKLDFEKVTFRPVPEPAARIAALLKGEADIITKVPPDDVERINKSASAKVAGVFYSGFYVLNSNYERPFPMNSKLVHQALSLAIDRDAIAKDLWRGQGIAPNGVYPKGNMAFDQSLPPLPYDPAKAKELLKQAGYKNEEIVIESTDGYVANDKPMAEAIVSMWKEVGVNAKLEVIEYSVRAQKYRARSFKGFFWTDPTDIFNDPAGQVWRLAGPGAPSAYLRIPEWEKIMEQAVVTFDAEKRRHMYLDAQKIFMEHLMWIPVIQPIESYGVQKFIDWKPRGNQILRVEKVKFLK